MGAGLISCPYCCAFWSAVPCILSLWLFFCCVAAKKQPLRQQLFLGIGNPQPPTLRSGKPFACPLISRISKHLMLVQILPEVAEQTIEVCHLKQGSD
jgi:hypothetical protein